MTTARAFKSLKDLPKDHLLAPGTPMCAGCGGLEVIKVFYDALGSNTVFVNAAGCMTLLSVYPSTPLYSSWLYTAMASASAGAQGVRDALDVLIDKGRLSSADDLHVVVLTGDGSATGMGLSATSAAMDRGLDVYTICYDNEGYGNTGQQTSAATPHGARTATDVFGASTEKKDLFTIWAAHRPSYLATMIGSDPLDIARKVQEARSIKGPKMFIGLSPCPTGWRYPPERSVELGRLAVRTGVFPLKVLRNGEVHHTRIPKPRLPVERYLAPQGRFRHLFEPALQRETLEGIQARVDAYWAKVVAS